jgi:hypothetical protein
MKFDELSKMQMKEFWAEEDDVEFDLDEILEGLDRQLPQLPPPPAPEKPEVPIPRDDLINKKRWIGKLRPPKDKDKGKQKAKKQKKAKKDKDAFKGKWEEYPRPPDPPFAVDYQEAHKKRVFEVKNLSHMNRGTLDKIRVDPCLIQELLLPDNPPKEVLIFLEAAHYAHNTSNYYGAFKNYQAAQRKWAEYVNHEMPDYLSLYFEY